MSPTTPAAPPTDKESQMFAANSADSFKGCIGKRVVGYFKEGGDSYMVFEDGTAFVLHHENGSYWRCEAKQTVRAFESDHVSHIKPKDALALADVLIGAVRG